MTNALPAALLAGVAALALAGPAAALTNPPPCEPGEPRIRCAEFRPGEAWRIIAPPGDSVTVIAAPGSEILTVAGARVAELRENAPPKEWQVAYEGNLAYFTPLAGDIPTSSATLTVRMPNGQLVPHILELNTREGFVNLLPATAPQADRERMNADTMFSVTFSYPALEAEKRAEEAAKRAEEARAAALARAIQAGDRRAQLQQVQAADILRQDVFYGAGARTSGFEWRCQNETGPCGNEEIRPLRISANGMTMALEFTGNGRMPRPYVADNGECDGKEEALVPFNMNGPNLMIIHGEWRHLCLRRDRLVGEIRNRDYDPSRPANPMTGTTSPRVVRVLRRGAPG